MTNRQSVIESFHRFPNYLSVENPIPSEEFQNQNVLTQIGFRGKRLRSVSDFITHAQTQKQSSACRNWPIASGPMRGNVSGHTVRIIIRDWLRRHAIGQPRPCMQSYTGQDQVTTIVSQWNPTALIVDGYLIVV